MKKVGKVFYIRPDFTKSMHCRTGNGTTCEDCASFRGCWHGVQNPQTPSEIEGSDMAVKVQAGSKFQRFVTVMGATCARDTNGSWSITPLTITNGRIQLFIDYDHFSDIIANPQDPKGAPVWTHPGANGS